MTENPGLRKDDAGRAPVTLRRADSSDIDALSTLLARAFDDDPMMHWVVRQGPKRATRMKAMFDVSLRYLSAELREAYVTPTLSGCVVWKGPSDMKVPLLRQLRLGPAFLSISGPLGMFRVAEMFQRLEERHARLVPEPHFYLYILGVEPALQRHGIGSALLRPVLDRCDAEGIRAYLETGRASNVPFYERHGFRVVETWRIRDSPVNWLMRREV